MGDDAFAFSTINSIGLPSTLKRLELETFWLCKNLKSLEIPNGVERVERGCFSCSGIEEITLPSTLKEMNEKAFNDCSSLETVWVEEGCTLDVKKCVEADVEVRYK